MWLTMTLAKWSHKRPLRAHTDTHDLISAPPTPGTLQKLEQITPLCACSDSDCCYIQIGFQVASCVRSAPWDTARRTTHGDYYPSWRRPACGASPLQIGPTRPSSSPQPSKHPFPPSIITVNHCDSSVHGLSLCSGVVILLYQPRVCTMSARADKHQCLRSRVQSAGSAPKRRHTSICTKKKKKKKKKSWQSWEANAELTSTATCEAASAAVSHVKTEGEKKKKNPCKLRCDAFIVSTAPFQQKGVLHRE